MIVLVAALATYWLHSRAPASVHQAAAAARGTIVRSITATGTVNPVTLVQVGSCVSGAISAIYVDFNSPVKAGQLLGKIDPRMFQAQLDLNAIRSTRYGTSESA